MTGSTDRFPTRLIEKPFPGTPGHMMDLSGRLPAIRAIRMIQQEYGSHLKVLFDLRLAFQAYWSHSVSAQFIWHSREAWLRWPLMALSPVMAALKSDGFCLAFFGCAPFVWRSHGSWLVTFGALKAHGCARGLWYSLMLWLRSRALVLSRTIVTLAVFGALLYNGCAHLFWHSRPQWLRSLVMGLSWSMAALSYFGTLSHGGCALRAWRSHGSWLHSNSLVLSWHSATLNSHSIVCSISIPTSTHSASLRPYQS